MQRLHLRKPDATPEGIEALLHSIDSAHHKRIAIHYYHNIAIRNNTGGIHLSGRTPTVPEEWGGRVSASCHTFQEVEALRDRCDYVFLSPIYDSVSKVGYSSAFTPEQLAEARDKGVLDHRVVAQGGVTPERTGGLAQLGFGGAAVLGWLWGDAKIEGVAQRMQRLQDVCRNAMFLRLGYEFGQSRVIVGAHWQSDVDAGRMVGAAAVARMHADETFVRELAEAKAVFDAMTKRKPVLKGKPRVRFGK